MKVAIKKVTAWSLTRKIFVLSELRTQRGRLVKIRYLARGGKLFDCQLEPGVLLDSNWNFRWCILSRGNVWALNSAEVKVRKVVCAGVTSLVLACYESSGTDFDWGWGGSHSAYGFHSCSSIFSRPELEHSSLIYESLWIRVLKQLQPAFLFFGFPYFCWVSSLARPLWGSETPAPLSLHFQIWVGRQISKKKTIARTKCCNINNFHICSFTW